MISRTYTICICVENPVDDLIKYTPFAFPDEFVSYNYFMDVDFLDDGETVEYSTDPEILYDCSGRPVHNSLTDELYLEVKEIWKEFDIFSVIEDFEMNENKIFNKRNGIVILIQRIPENRVYELNLPKSISHDAPVIKKVGDNLYYCDIVDYLLKNLKDEPFLDFMELLTYRTDFKFIYGDSEDEDILIESNLDKSYIEISINSSIDGMYTEELSSNLVDGVVKFC